MAAAGTRAGAAPDMAGFELVVGGMTCAACAARVQAKLNKVTGVTASVNLSTERAYVTAPAQLSARDLIDVVEAAGYTAELAALPEQDAGADATAAADEAAVRRLRRRLTLALVFFVPLTDLSLMLSVFPWTRFPGWQWLLVALAAPVAIWAAWPFHAAALRQARHLSSSMDTLVCWYDDSVHQSPLQQSRITAAASSATVSRELGGDPTIPCNPEISTKRIFQSLRTTTDPSLTTKAPWPSPLTGAVLCRVPASSSK